MAVSAIGDHTVEFTLPVRFAPFLRSMGTAIYPRHVLEQHVEDGTFADVWGTDTDPAEIVGTGPFTIADYEPGRQLVLARNPDYWLTDADGNRLPYLDRIVHNIVEDVEAELDGFLAGESDVHGVLGKEYAQIEPRQDEGDFTIHRRGPNFGSTFLTFNANPGANPDTGEPYVAAHKLDWFSNVQFRQAVAHSIDKGAIIDDVQHGLGYAQWSSVSPSAGDFHNPDVRRYPYDPDKANAILDSLGWVDTDGDGIREDSDGNDIEFRLVTNAGNTVREAVAEIIHEGMEAVGLAVDYEAIDFAEIVSGLTSTYDWEAVVIGLTGGADPYSGIDVWHSTGDLHMWYPNQPVPATSWEAEIDAMYIFGSQELDHARRVRYYLNAQEIAADNVPLIYTTLAERLTATRNVFGNTTPTLYGIWDVRYLYRTDQ